MSSSTTTSNTNINTDDPSTSTRKGSSSLLENPSLSSTSPTTTTNTNSTATLPSTMSPPPPPIGHASSSEYQPIKRRRSSSSSTRSSGHFAAAAVPTVSVPAPTYSGHHRSSSASRPYLPYPPLHHHHHRSSSSASRDDHRSPSPGSSSSTSSTFVLPPGVSISQITPNVFVGNNASSTSIQTLMHYGITSMVSLLSTAEQQLNEEAWSSPALEMLVPKQNRLFVRCEDSPEEDLVGRLGMICEFVEEQVEEWGGFEGGPGGEGSGSGTRRRRKKSVEEVLESVLPASEVPEGFNTWANTWNVGQEEGGPAGEGESETRRRRKQSVEEVLESVLPASEVPKGFNTWNVVGQEKPKSRQQMVRSLIPDEEGRVEGPTPAQRGAEDMAELKTRQKSRRRESASASAPQRQQRVRSLIPDDVEPAGGPPSTSQPKPIPIPSVPSGPSIPSVPSAPVPSLPARQQSSQQSHLLSLAGSSTPSQLSALSPSPSAQAGPSNTSPSTNPPTSLLSTQSSSLLPAANNYHHASSPNTEEGGGGGKVLIHCNQGVSRSGAACVAYIMKQNNPNQWSAEKALRFVQLRRKEVEPSENFMKQLRIWGEECGFEVWEVEDASKEGNGKGLEVDGKSVDGKKKKKIPKGPYKKWLEKREEVRRRVGEMGGLVLPSQDQDRQV